MLFLTDISTVICFRLEEVKMNKYDDRLNYGRKSYIKRNLKRQSLIFLVAEQAPRSCK